VGGRRYATAPLSEPVFSGGSLSLDELRWATDRLHAVRRAGPRPLAPALSFWAAPDPFEHPDPVGAWTVLAAATTAPPDFPLLVTDGRRLGDDPDWRPLLTGLRRAGLRHVWLTFAGWEATHDALCGRPGAFAAAVRAMQRARDAGLGVGANLLVSTRSAGQLADLTRLVYRFRADPARPQGVSVLVPSWTAVAPAYEPLRPAPEDLAGLPPADLAPLWADPEFWADPGATTEGALTRALLAAGPAGAAADAGARGGDGDAPPGTGGRSLSLLVTAGMDVLVGLPYAPPLQRLANLRHDSPERVHAALAALDAAWPPAPPPDAALAARYGDPASRKVYPSLAGLRRKWIHAWRTEQRLPWLAA
jgi:hypothetical protein